MVRPTETESSYARGILAGLLPDPPIDVSEWAEQRRVLSPSTAGLPGRWSNDLTPYAIEPMRELSPRSAREEVVLMWASQTGKTEVALNWLGAIVDVVPAPTMIVWPDLKVAEKNSKMRLEPLFTECPTLAAKVGARGGRNRSNTLLFKEFPGGFLVVVGAQSASGLASTPIRFLIEDELDRYAWDADGEGDPVLLAERRQASFRRRKRLKVSTPTTKGESRIDAAFEAGDQRRYHVPCWKCGFEQTLIWKHLRWDDGDPSTVRYECSECGFEHLEHLKPDMLRAGTWVPAFPGRAIYSSHLSALYSPFETWEKLVEAFLDAKQDPSKLKVFVNTVWAETWEEPGEAPPWEPLYRRSREKPYQIGTVPTGGCVLTIGVDVQGGGNSRWEAEVVAWGPKWESWSVDYRVFHGDHASPQFWAALEELLNEEFPCEGGGTLRCARMAVDASYATQDVYRWTAGQDPQRVMAVQGEDTTHMVVGLPKIVEVNRNGKRLRRGGRYWPLGVSGIKSELHGWFRQLPPLLPTDPKPVGLCHWPEYDPAYFQGLCTEKLVTEKRRGYTKRKWVATGRNEPFDCRVYARGAAHALGVHRWKQRQWSEALALTMAAPVANLARAARAARRQRPRPRSIADDLAL